MGEGVTERKERGRGRGREEDMDARMKNLCNVLYFKQFLTKIKHSSVTFSSLAQ